MPWRNRFKTNEEYNAWYRDYRAKNRERIRKYNRAYNQSWRAEHGYHNEIKWTRNHPTAVCAQRLAKYALRKAIFPKQSCELCGDNNAVMHHENYAEPLNIRWLCKVHHRLVHYKTLVRL